MTIEMIPLSNLNPGSDASPPINMRKADREAGIDSMAASLQAHGQIQTLFVRDKEGVLYVEDGERRLRAFWRLRDNAFIPADHMVACNVVPYESTNIGEISLAANFEALPPHEADIYERFHELAAGGMAQGDIARRFGIDEVRVKRILALGALSPLIVEAWRNNDIGDHPHEAVRALTMAPSIAEQERVFKDLHKRGRLYSHLIRSELFPDAGETKARLTFVGKEAYVAAGGRIVEDLFDERHVLQDVDVLDRLVQEKLQEKCDALIKAGWKWAEIYDQEEHSRRYSWAVIESPNGNAPKKQRAISGCIVDVDYSGAFRIDYGCIKPTDEPKANNKTTGENSASDKAPTISNAMAHRLSIQGTMAAQHAAMRQGRVALVALLAGFVAGGWVGQAIRVRVEGFGHVPSKPESFAAAFKSLSKLRDKALFDAAAAICATTIDLQRHSAEKKPFDDEGGPLVNAFDAKIMGEALKKHFDLRDYFSGVSKPIALQAIREALGEEQAREAAKKKKADLVEYAVTNMPATDWLPPQLRWAGYTGPGAVEAEKDS